MTVPWRKPLFGNATAKALAALRASALAYWPCNEGSGSVLHDATGHGYQATFSVAPTWSGAPNGYAVNPGASNEAQLATTPPLGIMSFSGWVNASSYPAYGTLFSCANSNTNLSYVPFWVGLYGGKFGCSVGLGANGTCQVVAPNAPSTGTWHHVCGTYDGVTAVTLYVDGVFVGTSTTLYAQTAQNHAYIAGAQGGLYLGNALLEELGLWPIVFDQNEVTALWNKGSPYPLYP